jgi:chromosome segregation ATPase
LQLQDARTQLRGREQRAVEVQAECEILREQSARQSAVICSLKKRQNELEERERGLNVSSGRVEADLQTSLRDRRYLEEKVKELEKKTRSVNKTFLFC